MCRMTPSLRAVARQAERGLKAFLTDESARVPPLRFGCLTSQPMKSAISRGVRSTSLVDAEK